MRLRLVGGPATASSPNPHLAAARGLVMGPARSTAPILGRAGFGRTLWANGARQENR